MQDSVFFFQPYIHFLHIFSPMDLYSLFNHPNQQQSLSIYLRIESESISGMGFSPLFLHSAAFAVNW